MPGNAIEKAKEVSPRKKFKNIKAYKTSFVEPVYSNHNNEESIVIYNLNGVIQRNLLEDLNPGIYIIKEGSEVRKIEVK